MKETVLIIGAGPAGTASAMNLLKAGFQPVIIEAETFPRYRIGESLTTECVDALGRLDLVEKLSKLKAPQKKGVRIFSKHPKNSFYVGAGDAWQVERATFDGMMLETAVERGAEHFQGKVRKLTHDENQWNLEIELPDGKITADSARFVIDASGQHRFSERQGIFGPLKEGEYSRQIAIFSQYESVTNKPEDAFDTLILYRAEHEWVWMIPLSETRTSVGLVLTVDEFKRQKLPLEEFLDARLGSFTAPVIERIGSARRVEKVRAISNYSYQIDDYVHEGLFCVGDSHGFIDPIFSFGVEFAVVEAEYAAKAIQACAESPKPKWNEHARRYVDITTSAQGVIRDMLAYFWAHPWGFANMAHVRHKGEFLELFAGRIYEIKDGAGLKKMRASIG